MLKFRGALSKCNDQNLNWKFKKFKASQIELKILNWEKKNKDVFEKIEKTWKLFKLDKVQNQYLNFEAEIKISKIVMTKKYYR